MQHGEDSPVGHDHLSKDGDGRMKREGGMDGFPGTGSRDGWISGNGMEGWMDFREQDGWMGQK